MEMHGNLNMLENQLKNTVLGIDTNFPADPKVGRLVFKDKVLYICTENEGLPVWVPMTKTLQMLTHVQSVDALEWTFQHNLNSSSVFVQVYDEDGKWIIPDFINVNVFNQVTVGFSIPTKGKMVVMRGETEGSAQTLTAYEESFTNSDTWVVHHQLGHNPIIRVIVGTNEVQPASITYDNTMTATVHFTSPQTGSVRCI